MYFVEWIILKSAFPNLGWISSDSPGIIILFVFSWFNDNFSICVFKFRNVLKILK